ncbi:MAG: type II secretion system F family protein [Jatrophihabitans sp.]|uniref:type II secretion system F family protein n=1 Tax=Jatrophihabitans sp. TaxID=1932789 RepID=UPI003F80F83C
MTVLLALTFGCVLTFALLITWTPKRKDDDPLAVVDMYRVTAHVVEPEMPAAPPQESKLLRVALAFLDRQVRARGAREKIAATLDAAGLTMRPEEFVLLRLGITLVLGATVMVLFGSLLLGLLLGVAIAWIATRLFVSIRTTKRQVAFGEQLPDVLQLVAGALRSGFSLSQSLDTVVREGEKPAADEFARALAEARFGADVEDALDRVADRMKCTDLSWVVMAIRIQRSVGGNLAEILMTTVGTMRERASLRRTVRALSAEGRLSGRILIGLPIFVVGFVQMTNPGYIRPLFHTSTGTVLLVVAVVLELLGSVWIKKVSKVDI